MKSTYQIVKRKGYNGYFVRKINGELIIHHPNNEKLRREQKYTSKKGMTYKNANKQLSYLNNILHHTIF